MEVGVVEVQGGMFLSYAPPRSTFPLEPAPHTGGRISGGRKKSSEVYTHLSKVSTE